MSIDAKLYAAAWYQALKQAQDNQDAWDSISQKLLTLLKKQGKTALLSDIETHLIEFIKADSDIVSATVKVAHEHSQEFIIDLVKQLTSANDLDLTIETDQSIIGGIVIETSNNRWDLSVKQSLEQMKKSLLQ